MAPTRPPVPNDDGHATPNRAPAQLRPSKPQGKTLTAAARKQQRELQQRVEEYLQNPFERDYRMPPLPLIFNNHYVPSESATRCDICFNMIGDRYLKLDCRHNHCWECLRRNARVAMASVPFQPARCCAQLIPLDVLAMPGVLSNEETTQYYMRLEEHTSPLDRLYCYRPGCGAYVPRGMRGPRAGLCVRCMEKTCRACKAKTHFGACDPAVLQAARQEAQGLHHLACRKGWKSCPGCNNIIQKDGGCDHMHCTCGQSFCYNCGQARSAEAAHSCTKQRAG
ncbi:hypothetical protein Hte_004620 [Hypoxylon texense]